MLVGSHDSIGRLNVTHFVDAAAEAAFEAPGGPPDGSLAYRDDLRLFRARVNGGWQSLTTATTGPLHLYLDPVNGSDANNGLSTLTPVRTIMQLDLLIPLWVQHVVTLHTAAGDATLDRPWTFLERVVSGGGSIRLYADEVWDPNIYTVVTTQVAQAGTGATQVVGVGLPAIDGMWIEFTDGAAAGQFRTIRDATATVITPCEVFGYNTTAAPSPGDTFRVIRPAFRIVIPFDVGSLVRGSEHAGGSLYQYAGDFGAAELPPWEFQGIGVKVGQWLELVGELLVNGMYVENDAGTNLSAVCQSGLVLRTGADDNYIDDVVFGWGLTLAGSASRFFAIDTGVLEGYFRCSDTFQVNDRVYAVVLGGSAGLWFANNGAWLRITPYQIAVAATRLAAADVSVLQAALVALGAVASGVTPRVQVQQNATLVLSSTVTGSNTTGNTVSVSSRGYLRLNGAPALGGASVNDWDIGDGMPFNKALFDAANVAREYHGAVVERYN